MSKNYKLFSFGSPTKNVPCGHDIGAIQLTQDARKSASLPFRQRYPKRHSEGGVCPRNLPLSGVYSAVPLRQAQSTPD
jgi:hypothetical protein